MSEDLKTKIFTFLAHITVKRWLITAGVAISAIGLYSVFENRQKLFEAGLGSVGSYVTDFIVQPPSKAQHEIAYNFLRLHPEIAFMTLIDADPLTNTRKVVHRFTLDPVIERYFAELDRDKPGVGDGPLFNNVEANNSQVIAISNGEFLCSPVKGGLIERIYPEIAKTLVKSCRVPLPPAFRRAGGWFAIHLKSDVDENRFKTDALTMSFLYFEAVK